VIRTRPKDLALSIREPLIVCLLGLPATSPLWKSTLPRSFDGLFHLYRLLELDHLLRHGILFSRWAPDLFFGYGYPVFDFVPLLPYYLAEMIHMMGLSLLHTTLLSFTLALLASGLAMYFFVKDIFGSKAALLSAVAYMYAPFHLYDISFRGHLPGAWATVLYPLLLWSFRRLMYRGGPSYLVSSTLLYAACFLTHNPATLIFIPFLILYTIVLVLARKGDRPAAGARVATAIVIGTGVASFFWIPALWDRQWVQLERMVTPPDLDFHTHFISLAELLAPSPVADTGLMNPGLLNNIGPVLVSLSIFTAVSLWKFRRLDRLVHLGISIFSLAMVIFMVLPQSAFIWENLPLLKYLTYPHRFLRLGSLAVAILCGAAACIFPDNMRRFSPSFLVTAASIAMIIVSTFSLLYPPYYGDLPLNPSFVDMMEFERQTETIGTTSFGEYLPVWAEWIPPNSPLEPMYRSSGTIERLDGATLPDGTQITDAQYAPTSMIIRLDSPESFQATFNSLYFPGWQAYLDGNRTSIVPTPGQGLISVLVPAGEHSLQLRFEDMPHHTLSKLIAALSTILLILLSAGLALRPSWLEPVNSLLKGRKAPDNYEEGTSQMNSWQVSMLASIAVTLLALKIGFIDGHDTWFKRGFDGLHVNGVQSSLQINFGDQITLLGYDLGPFNPYPGDTLSLDLYWKARQNLATDYSAFAHLVDDEMNIYAQKDSLNPGRYPTRYWKLDEYNKDPHEIIIPPGTPPGDYVLGVGLYDSSTLMRLPIVEGEGHRDGMLTLQEVTILNSIRPPDIDALEIQKRTSVDFSNGMTLLGYSVERQYLAQGDFCRLALFWQARRHPDDNYVVNLRLLDREGETALYHSSEPSAGRYPTSQWEEGEIVRDNHSLWIRPDFPSGDYALQLVILTPKGEKVAVDAAEKTSVVEGWLELTTMQTGD
jgi:hypothetical protein